MKILAIDWLNAIDVVVFGFSMVFLILILLVGLVSIFGAVVAQKVLIQKAQLSKSKNVTKTAEKKEYEEAHLSAEVSAAIALALHLYYADVHDEESHIMTIKTVERRYSPWSSKIYGLNNLVK
ncbi:MAG TPA: OadG family transporter subunit [Paludibacter sp.]